MVTHVVFDGVADGPLGVALDVVAAAARLVKAGLVEAPLRPADLKQRVVSVDGRSVRTAAGRTLAVDGALDVRRVKAGEVLAVPGLGAVTEREIDTLLSRPDIVRGAGFLAECAGRRAVVAASCSATFVVGASGALDGRRATTTWWLYPAFSRRFPRVELCADKMVVDAGGVMTAGAAFAHADLLLAILARNASPTLANLVARYLVLDERVSQSRYMVVDHLRTSDPAVQKLEAFLLANLGRQVPIDEMARATATSPRTLARRLDEALGTTPQRFAQRLRMARAVHLLETTGRSVEDVAFAVGYADAAAFRRVFRRETGEAPGSRRRSGDKAAAVRLRSSAGPGTSPGRARSR